MLIQPAYVKNRFPLWQTYTEHAVKADPPDANRTPDDVLAQTIADAEAELSSYIRLENESELTPALRLRLLHLVKKHLFDLKHGNRAWGEEEDPPQIVRDYWAARSELKRYRDGKADLTGNPQRPERFRVSAPDRRFTGPDGESEWFTRE